MGRSGIALLEGGAFDASATDAVYSALQFFSLGIILHSVLEIVARAFYADKDTLTPLYSALVGAVFGMLVAVVLPPLIGVGALALANSTAIGVEVAILIVILRRRWDGVNGPVIAGTLTRSLVASAVMAFVIILLDSVLATIGFGQSGGGKLNLAIRIIMLVAAGGLTYVAVALLVGMHEIREVIRLLIRRGQRDTVASVAEG